MPTKRLCIVVLMLAACLFVRSSNARGEAFWPQFRGPGGRGVAEGAGYPAQFSRAKNVVWTTEVPPGRSSPCVWGDRIFLTGFDGAKLETLCVDRQTGEVLWRRVAPAERLEAHRDPGGPAASTPATDGQRVYVYFGSVGLLCYDFDGNEVWRHALPRPITGWGSGVSPIVADALVILKCDQDVGSFLLAVDRKTGKQAWRTERPRWRRSYGTPIVWRHDDVAELVVPGALELAAYDLRTGTERWSVRGLPADMCTTPTAGGGLLYVASWGPGGEAGSRTLLPEWKLALERYDKNKDGRLVRDEMPEGSPRNDYGEVDADKDGFTDRAEWETARYWYAHSENALLAIRPGGRGDVTKTHVAWKQTRGLPYVPSALHYRGRIYLVKNGGIATCYDARTGRQVFQGRLGATGGYHASPVAADGRIYAASRRGVVTVFAAADELTVLARNELGEAIVATPALVDGKVYVRTERHLYAFER